VNPRAPSRLARRAVVACLPLLLLGATRLPSGELELEDVLQVLELDHALLAVDAHGGDIRIDLEIGEKVLHREARGRVGVAFTDRRLLAVAARSAAWQSERIRIDERLLEAPLLGDRVALFLTNKRALGFDGGSGNLVEHRFGPHEDLTRRAISNSIAVVVTDLRALAVSPFRGGFFAVSLRPDERDAALEITGTIATLTTPRRLLTFDARSGRWRERRTRFLR